MDEHGKGFPLMVGIASGLATAAVSLLAFWQFFTDDSSSRMLESADGIQSALVSIAEAIDKNPGVLGESDASATEFARTAEAVTASVEQAAETRGLKIASTSKVGEEFVLKRNAPQMMETPGGTLFGDALHQEIFQIGFGDQGILQINNVRYGSLQEGDIVRFEVGGERCQAFISDIRPELEEVAVALRCG